MFAAIFILLEQAEVDHAVRQREESESTAQSCLIGWFRFQSFRQVGSKFGCPLLFCDFPMSMTVLTEPESFPSKLMKKVYMAGVDLQQALLKGLERIPSLRS